MNLFERLKFRIYNFFDLRKHSVENFQKLTVVNVVWAIVKNGKLQIYSADGEKLYLGIKKGAWKIKPSINKWHLNEVQLTLYVNLADDENEMYSRIEEKKQEMNAG